MTLALLLAVGAGCALDRPSDRDSVTPAESDDEPNGQRARSEFEPIEPERFDESAVAMGHFSPARRASTAVAGPTDDTSVDVDVVKLDDALGDAVGASPWHVTSSPRYAESGAVTLWGSTLTDTYKFVVDGERFEAVDRYRVNELPVSMTWNLIADDSGNVYVPDPNGHATFGARRPCRSGTEPVILVMTDRNDSGDPSAPIGCQDAINLVPDDITALCAAADEAVADQTMNVGITGNSLVPTYSGEIATTAIFESADGTQTTYLIILGRDGRIGGPSSCGRVGAGVPTNEMAAEPLSDGTTAFYVPLSESLAKVTYDGAAVDLVWDRNLDLRRRTGTTPTLLDSPSGERFVVLIDGQCATASVVNGLIVCDEAAEPSELIAVRRDDSLDGRPAVIRTDLPPWLRTVENSPSAWGDTVVVASYSGYVANGLLVPPEGQRPDGGLGDWLTSPDATADVATGILALDYNAETDGFEIRWSDQDTQVNSITTISGGANIVYGVGAEEVSQRLFLYGFDLDTGSRDFRVDLGPAPFPEATVNGDGHVVFDPDDYTFDDELFDAGNQVLLLDDGSIVVSGQSALARIRQID